MALLCWISVWLCVRVNHASFMLESRLNHAPPPVADTFIAFVKVCATAYHGVKKNFAFIAVFLKQGNRPLAVFNLLVGIAPELYAVNPFAPCKQLGIRFVYQSGVKCLVEIYLIATAYYLAELLKRIVTTCENVVIHKHKVLAPLNGNLINIHIRAHPPPLFSAQHTKSIYLGIPL